MLQKEDEISRRKNVHKLEGIFVPHITPFTRQGDLDTEALKECVRFWMESGIAGLVACGSNGEAPYLSREERRKIIEIVVEKAGRKIAVIAGTGATSTRETIQYTRDAKDVGVDAALVVTPYYFRLSDREIYEHYKAVIRAVDIPVVLYSVPKFTGISLEPSVIVRLASEHSSVIGVKDSTGNITSIAKTTRLIGDKISVLAGTADVILPTLMLGGTGAIIAIANVFPRVCVELYEAFRAKDFENASRIQKQIFYINEVLVKKHNQLGAIKDALTMEGFPAGYPRKPALPLPEKEKEDIKKLMCDM